MRPDRGLFVRSLFAMALVASMLLLPASSDADAPSDDGVLAFGAPALGAALPSNIDSPVVAIASSGGGGYWEVTEKGQVLPFGSAEFAGTTAGRALAAPIVAMAGDPDGSGYWLAAADGGVFAFDATFAGSAGGLRLAAPVRAIAANADGSGYWLLGEDGGVFAFGGAPFLGSAVGHRDGARYVGIAGTASGAGYWVATSDGEVVAFGDAAGRGAPRIAGLAAPVVGIAADRAGTGFWLAAADGGVFAVGAEFRGSAATLALGARPVIGIAADPLSGGYWLARATSAAPAPTCGAGAFPLAQVRPGMSAYGLTVASGSTVERFDVTVIGTLEDAILPGVDMIVVRADSPSIRAAGGIWQGMSGSPVYAPDGRLLGAVAYGMSWSPSPIAGLTPAEWMLGLANRGVETQRVAQMSTAADDAGLVPLATPISVTAPRDHRFGTARELLTSAGIGPATYYRGSPAPITAAAATSVQPGSQIALALSYGDVTVAATGTVTAVCGDTVLAFGHPVTARGSIQASAHTAEVVYVQPDPLGVPYAATRIGGTIGAAVQDRFAGVRIQLGAPPKGATVTTHIYDATSGTQRAAETIVNPLFPDIAWSIANQLYGELLTVQQQDGAGIVQLRWKATGATPDGTWQLARTDRYASPWYVDSDAAFDVASLLDQVLGANPFVQPTLTSLDIVATARDEYSSYRITGASADTGDGFVALDPVNGLIVDPGTDMVLRVDLKPFGGGAATSVDVALAVPMDAAGISGGLTISGGRGYLPVPEHEPGSFEELLAMIDALPRNDDLSTSLSFGLSGIDTNVTTRLDAVATGAVMVPVYVTGGAEPGDGEGEGAM